MKGERVRTGRYFMMGNDACAEGALAAGCEFAAGYPITPATEIANRLAKRLPQVDGVFLQMEDEISSIAAVIGASWTGKKAMTVNLISFGFKYGVPQNVDLLFDARFLPNPNFVPELKPLNGMDKKVADYVFKNRITGRFVKKIEEFIDFLIPLYIMEGRSYVTIGVGCTGGNHRSPAIVEKLFRYLKKHPIDLSVIHRDIS